MVAKHLLTSSSAVSYNSGGVTCSTGSIICEFINYEYTQSSQIHKIFYNVNDLNFNTLNRLKLEVSDDDLNAFIINFGFEQLNSSEVLKEVYIFYLRNFLQNEFSIEFNYDIKYLLTGYINVDGTINFIQGLETTSIDVTEGNYTALLPEGDYIIRVQNIENYLNFEKEISIPLLDTNRVDIVLEAISEVNLDVTVNNSLENMSVRVFNEDVEYDQTQNINQGETKRFFVLKGTYTIELYSGEDLIETKTEEVLDNTNSVIFSEEEVNLINFPFNVSLSGVEADDSVSVRILSNSELVEFDQTQSYPFGTENLTFNLSVIENSEDTINYVLTVIDNEVVVDELTTNLSLNSSSEDFITLDYGATKESGEVEYTLELNNFDQYETEADQLNISILSLEDSVDYSDSRNIEVPNVEQVTESFMAPSPTANDLENYNISVEIAPIVDGGEIGETIAGGTFSVTDLENIFSITYTA